MKITILQFEVEERYVLRHTYFNKIINWFLGRSEPDEYHFDVVMKVKDSVPRNLLILDIIQLPNKVRLMVWSVDRFGVVRAKTIKLIKEDIRGYKPDVAYLVYPLTHGHLKD